MYVNLHGLRSSWEVAKTSGRATARVGEGVARRASVDNVESLCKWPSARESVQGVRASFRAGTCRLGAAVRVSPASAG